MTAESSVRDRVLMALAAGDGQAWTNIADATRHTAEMMYGKQADALAAARLLAGGLTINTDPKPQPGDGPEYHADLAAWHERHQPKHRKEGTP